MDISQIDSNFKQATVEREDIEWHSVMQENFSLHGVFYDKELKKYLRMPYTIAKSVNEDVAWLSSMTAGGRLRFSTDSPFVAIRCIAPTFLPSSQMPLSGSHGFGLFVDGMYRGKYAPDFSVLMNAIYEKSEVFAFDGLCDLAEGVKNCTLFFPLYNGLFDLQIGLKKDCVLRLAPTYKYEKKIVFYGSSITQGGCASVAGHDYIGLLSEWLGFDYVNLGISGSCKAEDEMGEYLADLDALMYVLDYDYNAPSAEYLEKTHYKLYERIRRKKKDAAILFMSLPNFEYVGDALKRREIIQRTYLLSQKQGDKNTYFVDGAELFWKTERNSCTVDTVHPTNLGFYRMAKTVEPILRQILNKEF